MNRTLIQSTVFVLLTLYGSGYVHADLPLTIEDLLTAKDRYRLEFNMVYANSDRRRVDSQFEILQVGPGRFIQIPVNVGETRRNSDIFVFTLGFRYGLSVDTELLTRLSGVLDNARTESGNGSDSDSNQRLNDLVIGINHRFSDDDETPAFLGFAELTLAENTKQQGSDFVYAKTVQVGFTTYRAIDPLVLSLTAGYRYAGKRDIDKHSTDPGDLVFINPRVAFAVNNEVTLTSGLQMRYRDKDKVGGKNQGISTTQTRLEMGLGYAWSKRTTLQLNASTDISGDEGAEVGLTALYKFGNLPD